MTPTRLAALAESAPDVLGVETVPPLVELEAITSERDGIGIPARVSVTVADPIRAMTPRSIGLRPRLAQTSRDQTTARDRDRDRDIG
ncbi:hypothetical protein [Microbacterium sp. LWH3-1.2]|uniref:hypothetical protein n=1 Tax=Microbacterium sp. LWH3-1.2 TaxID=3135256 RepID=UPI00341D3164